MSTNTDCSLCTARVFYEHKSHHDYRKHYLEATKRKFFILTEETLEVCGKNFRVLTRNSVERERRKINSTQIVERNNVPYYYCSVCRNEGYRDVMEKHLLMYHYQTHEERITARKVKKMKAQAKYNFCDICWEIFHQHWEEKNHYHSLRHQVKEEYFTGTGCDLCRTTINPLEDHKNTHKHIFALEYVLGSGCDICKKSMLADELEIHNATHVNSHNRLEQYINGTGCDICRLVIPTHENSNRHKKSIKKQEIVAEKIISKQKNYSVKSARF